MNPLNIALAGIIAFAGLPAGWILAKITKDELKHGIKYFYMIQYVLFIIAVIVTLYTFRLHLFLFIVLGIALVFMTTKVNLKPQITYPLFALFFINSLTNINILLLISSLIFLYGFPTAAITTSRH